MLKRKNCKKGHSCGGSCISVSKNCRVLIHGTGKALAGYLGKGSASSGGAKAKAGAHSAFIKKGEVFASGKLKPPSTEALENLKKELTNVEAEFDKVFDDDPVGAWKTPIGQRYSQLSNRVKELEGGEESLIKGMEEIRQKLTGRISREEAEALAGNAKILKSASKYTPESEIRSNLADFYQITGGKGADSLQKISLDDSRAYATKYDGRLNIGRSASKEEGRETFFHEMGHHVEFESEEVRDALESWIKSRSTSDEQQSLKEMTGINAYGEDEVAYPDKFISPYVGKVYDDGYTEVLSMGLEHFTSPQRMAQLYKNDPEHFYLTLGVLLD